MRGGNNRWLKIVTPQPGGPSDDASIWWNCGGCATHFLIVFHSASAAAIIAAAAKWCFAFWHIWHCNFPLLAHHCWWWLWNDATFSAITFPLEKCACSQRNRAALKCDWKCWEICFQISLLEKRLVCILLTCAEELLSHYHTISRFVFNFFLQFFQLAQM
jgi:hypothetical protein